MKHIKNHIKKILKIILFAFILYAIFWIGFFNGESQSPNAWDSERYEAVEKAYINCMDKLKGF